MSSSSGAFRVMSYERPHNVSDHFKRNMCRNFLILWRLYILIRKYNLCTGNVSTITSSAGKVQLLSYVCGTGLPIPLQRRCLFQPLLYAQLRPATDSKPALRIFLGNMPQNAENNRRAY